jgi:hypothetical protein
MIKRPALVALAGITALAGLVSTIAPPAEAAKKPKISSARATPSRIPGNGGAVTLNVTVQANGATVSGVTVRPSTGGTGATASLQSIGNNQFRGNISVTPNTGRKSRRVSFFITASTSRGSVKKTLVVTQDKGGVVDPNSPPPPPNI